MPLPDYLQQLTNPYRSVAGNTFEGRPPIERKKGLPAGGGNLGGETDSNPALAALHGNLSTLFGGNRFTGYNVSRAPTPYNPSGSMAGGKMSMGESGPSIHGYTEGGIPTDLFSQLTGRGPTADDVYNQNGGLAPQHNQMGGLPQVGSGYPGYNPYAGLGTGKEDDWVTRDRGKPSTPFPTGPALGEGDPNFNTLTPSTSRAPVDTSHYIPMQHLMRGDILGYIKSLQK